MSDSWDWDSGRPLPLTLTCEIPVLHSCSPPEEAAQVLLGGYIRSEDKEATLGGAEEIGEDLYVLEYTVKSKSKGWKRR